MPLMGFIGACGTTHHAAPVVDRSLPSVKSNEVIKQSASPPKFALRTADSQGFYTVKKGDTLIHIALDFGQNYRDIIAWNNLSNPNDIKVDQVLRVRSPEPGAIAAVVQTGSVTTVSTIDVKPVASGATPSSHKTEPQGDKRIYSDTLWVEMQKPETNGSVALVQNSKPEPAKSVDVKVTEKPANNGAIEDENVSWIWPTEGKIIGAYDEGKKGIDITGKLGQPVLAAESGKVMYAGSGIRGYGNLVIVKHTGSLLSAYAHNKTILVKEGQIVNKGQKIAEMGSSDTDIVKLHFEIRQQGKPIDPSKLLPTH